MTGLAKGAALDRELAAPRHDWLAAAAKRSHRTAEAMNVVIDAVERTEMDPDYAARDELLS